MTIILEKISCQSEATIQNLHLKVSEVLYTRIKTPLKVTLREVYI